MNTRQAGGAELKGSRWSTFPALQCASLFLLVLLAYMPALNAGFVWDDDRYVSNNPLLTAPDGFKQIWFSLHRQSQYFPLTYTTLKLQRMAWGLNPFGYHLVNILLHGTSAVLLWTLLRRLMLPGAWFAAAIFALHPVHVESVAWITEIKNTQSTVFFLLALLSWVKFTENGALPQRRRSYIAAAIFFIAALLSKTTACVFPAAMLLVLWLRKQPITTTRLLQVAPFVVAGIAMGLVSVFWERHLGSYNEEFQTTSLAWVERCLLASRAVWFYAGKLVWPANLTFSYPRWDVDSRNLPQYIWPLACVGFAVLMWSVRGKVGRGPVTAILFFVATLLPLLGFIPNYTFRYSYVADHYQYVASIGLICLFAGVVFSPAFSRALGSRARVLFCGLVLLALSVLTFHQAANYRDDETLWADTARKNPQSWLAYGYLGLYAELKGQLPQATTYYSRSVELQPSFEYLGNLGRVLMKQGRTGEAVAQFRKANALHPSGPTYYNLGAALAEYGDLDGGVSCLKKSIELSPTRPEPHFRLAILMHESGKISEAIAEYLEALRLDPNTPGASTRLASIRASSPDPRLRNGAEAVRLAERGCELTHYEDAFALSVLATAYAEAGRFDEAVTAARRAAKMAAIAGDQEGIRANERLCALFQSRQPYRDDGLTNSGPAEAHP